MGTDQDLGALAALIRNSREWILQDWSERVGRDPELTTASSISRTQFTDSIPSVLEAFEARLRADDGQQLAHAASEQRRSAGEHGSHRWQQGYDLGEVVREWTHLQQSVLALLERHAAAQPGGEPTAMARARRIFLEFFGAGICDSVAKYARLQRDEASGRVHDLERTLQGLRSLEQQRGQVLREAAHDLRGSVGVISNASAVLARSEAEPGRVAFYGQLERAAQAMQSLLSDLLDVARLEAGEERVEVQAFDAAVLLRNLGEALRPLAAERGLFLKTEGPETLPVEGDAIKVQRIAQNLLLNALRATHRGGVRVLWHAASARDLPRWMLRIEDTGPGLSARDSASLQQDLMRPDTRQRVQGPLRTGRGGMAQGGPEAPGSGEAPEASAPVAATTSGSGEGIGLVIVKRMCELLHASIELEAIPSGGTSFSLSFPASYPPQKG